MKKKEKRIGNGHSIGNVKTVKKNLYKEEKKQLKIDIEIM